MSPIAGTNLSAPTQWRHLRGRRGSVSTPGENLKHEGHRLMKTLQALLVCEATVQQMSLDLRFRLTSVPVPGGNVGGQQLKVNRLPPVVCKNHAHAVVL